MRADLYRSYFVGRTWERFKDKRWRMVVQTGLVPISVGLLGAGALLLARVADHSVFALAVTAGTAATAYFTRISPLWMFGIGGLLGLLGLI